MISAPTRLQPPQPPSGSTSICVDMEPCTGCLRDAHHLAQVSKKYSRLVQGLVILPTNRLCTTQLLCMNHHTCACSIWAFKSATSRA